MFYRLDEKIMLEILMEYDIVAQLWDLLLIKIKVHKIPDQYDTYRLHWMG